MTERQAEVLPERDLVELFRPRRADPESFRREIDRRIREKESDPSNARDIPFAPPDSFRAEFVRRAAALLPFDPTGGPGGVLGAAQLFTAALALPFAVVLASLGAFLAGTRSVRRSVDSATSAHKSTTRTSSWGMLTGFLLAQSIQTIGTLAILAMLFVRPEWIPDVLVGVFLTSTLALVIVVRGLASEAQLTQRNVQRFVTMILVGLLAGAFLWLGPLHHSDRASEIGMSWSGLVVAAGLMLIPLAARRTPGWRDIARTLLVVAIVICLNPIGVTYSTAGSVRNQLEALHLDASELAAWCPAAQAYVALTAAHAEPPDMSRIEGELDRALDTDVDAHPAVWTSAARMGVVRADQWERLASRRLEKYRLDQMLEGKGSLNLVGYNAYYMAMLLATRSPTPQQRLDLAERVEQSWPEAGRHDPFDAVVPLVAMLDELGLRERADALRPRVHDLLRRHWVDKSGDRYARIGGFTPNPTKFRTSFVETTGKALELMDRYGVPGEIDLRAVRGYLRAESVAFPLVFKLRPELKLSARSSLLRVERGIGLPTRSILESMLGERVLIAAILTVLLSLLAIRWAGESGVAPAHGALP